ncbi:MAG: PepSY domain-containing protein [Rhodospirillales bacterium]|nr:PepSY domain-containing protein [Rhodospirillales bacterium]MDH3917344.1 PepSY domain-containing protein [Rhodospirillales bacterium]MDH3965706.1 PepSY domain-containing protein [Rhodospirillales bacterium]
MTSGTEVVGESETSEMRLSVGRILSTVKAAGYTEVRKIEREHGVYQVDARDPKGWRVEIFVDAKTGGLVIDPETGKPRSERLSDKVPSGPLDFEAVVAQVKAEGYPEVYAIEYEHAIYEIKARDAAGRKVELYVHPKTGKLLKHPKTGNPLKEILDD